MDPSVPSLLDQVQSLGERYKATSSVRSKHMIRRELHGAVSKLGIALEDFGDIVDRFVYLPMNTALIRIAIDLDIFRHLVNAEAPVTAKELAERTQADYTLLSRILRSLATINALDEVDVETYLPTKVARSFVTEKGVSNLRYFFDYAEAGWHQLPYFLAENKYQNPVDPTHTSLHEGLGTTEPIFGWMHNHPQLLTDFNTFMRTQREGRANWLDYFPLDKDFSAYDGGEDGVMFVDIGGGLGHEIKEVRQRYNSAPGRFVLQDLPQNTNQVQRTELLEPMAHDFFNTQPIKGARIYYLRNILHDWPDDRCNVILRHTAAAMKEVYSKILINEFVIPERGASAFMAHIDMNMMSKYSAMERTEKQWRKLLEANGLGLVKIWETEVDSECIIEAALLGANVAGKESSKEIVPA